LPPRWGGTGILEEIHMNNDKLKTPLCLLCGSGLAVKNGFCGECRLRAGQDLPPFDELKSSGKDPVVIMLRWAVNNAATRLGDCLGVKLDSDPLTLVLLSVVFANEIQRLRRERRYPNAPMLEDLGELVKLMTCPSGSRCCPDCSEVLDFVTILPPKTSECPGCHSTDLADAVEFLEKKMESTRLSVTS
jgi:hypothetical protein